MILFLCEFILLFLVLGSVDTALYSQEHYNQGFHKLNASYVKPYSEVIKDRDNKYGDYEKKIKGLMGYENKIPAQIPNIIIIKDNRKNAFYVADQADIVFTNSLLEAIQNKAKDANIEEENLLFIPAMHEYQHYALGHSSNQIDKEKNIFLKNRISRALERDAYFETITLFKKKLNNNEAECIKYVKAFNDIFPNSDPSEFTSDRTHQVPRELEFMCEGKEKYKPIRILIEALASVEIGNTDLLNEDEKAINAYIKQVMNKKVQKISYLVLGKINHKLYENSCEETITDQLIFKTSHFADPIYSEIFSEKKITKGETKAGKCNSEYSTKAITYYEKLGFANYKKELKYNVDYSSYAALKSYDKKNKDSLNQMIEGIKMSWEKDKDKYNCGLLAFLTDTICFRKKTCESNFLIGVHQMNNFAIVAFNVGKKDLAETLFDKAHEIYDKNNHKDTDRDTFTNIILEEKGSNLPWLYYPKYNLGKYYYEKTKNKEKRDKYWFPLNEERKKSKIVKSNYWMDDVKRVFE